MEIRREQYRGDVLIHKSVTIIVFAILDFLIHFSITVIVFPITRLCHSLATLRKQGGPEVPL